MHLTGVYHGKPVASMGHLRYVADPPQASVAAGEIVVDPSCSFEHLNTNVYGLPDGSTWVSSPVPYGADVVNAMILQACDQGQLRQQHVNTHSQPDMASLSFREQVFSATASATAQQSPVSLQPSSSPRPAPLQIGSILFPSAPAGCGASSKDMAESSNLHSMPQPMQAASSKSIKKLEARYAQSSTWQQAYGYYEKFHHEHVEAHNTPNAAPRGAKPMPHVYTKSLKKGTSCYLQINWGGAIYPKPWGFGGRHILLEIDGLEALRPLSALLGCISEVAGLRSAIDVDLLGGAVDEWIKHPEPGSAAALGPLVETLSILDKRLRLPQVLFAWAVHRYNTYRCTDNPECLAVTAGIVGWAAAQGSGDQLSWPDSAPIPYTPSQSMPPWQDNGLLQDSHDQSIDMPAGLQTGYSQQPAAWSEKLDDISLESINVPAIEQHTLAVATGETQRGTDAGPMDEQDPVKAFYQNAQLEPAHDFPTQTFGCCSELTEADATMEQFCQELLKPSLGSNDLDSNEDVEVFDIHFGSILFNISSSTIDIKKQASLIHRIHYNLLWQFGPHVSFAVTVLLSGLSIVLSKHSGLCPVVYKFGNVQRPAITSVTVDRGKLVIGGHNIAGAQIRAMHPDQKAAEVLVPIGEDCTEGLSPLHKDVCSTAESADGPLPAVVVVHSVPSHPDLCKLILRASAQKHHSSMSIAEPQFVRFQLPSRAGHGMQLQAQLGSIISVPATLMSPSSACARQTHIEAAGDTVASDDIVADAKTSDANEMAQDLKTYHTERLESAKSAAPAGVPAYEQKRKEQDIRHWLPDSKHSEKEEYAVTEALKASLISAITEHTIQSEGMLRTDFDLVDQILDIDIHVRRPDIGNHPKCRFTLLNDDGILHSRRLGKPFASPEELLHGFSTMDVVLGVITHKPDRLRQRDPFVRFPRTAHGEVVIFACNKHAGPCIGAKHKLDISGVCTGLEEHDDEDEAVDDGMQCHIARWKPGQCQFIQKWRAAELAKLEQHHGVRVTIHEERAVVQGLCLKGERSRAVSFLEAELCIDSKKWCTNELCQQPLMLQLMPGYKAHSDTPSLKSSHKDMLCLPQHLLTAYMTQAIQLTLDEVAEEVVVVVFDSKYHVCGMDSDAVNAAKAHLMRHFQQWLMSLRPLPPKLRRCHEAAMAAAVAEGFPAFKATIGDELHVLLAARTSAELAFTTVAYMQKLYQQGAFGACDGLAEMKLPTASAEIVTSLMNGACSAEQMKIAKTIADHASSSQACEAESSDTMTRLKAFLDNHGPIFELVGPYDFQTHKLEGRVVTCFTRSQARFLDKFCSHRLDRLWDTHSLHVTVSDGNVVVWSTTDKLADAERQIQTQLGYIPEHWCN